MLGTSAEFSFTLSKAPGVIARRQNICCPAVWIELLRGKCFDVTEHFQSIGQGLLTESAQGAHHVEGSSGPIQHMLSAVLGKPHQIGDDSDR